MRKIVALLWIGCVAASLCSAAVAETRALLVGVSGYPTLPRNMHLKGPLNDVQLMRVAIARQGIPDKNIQVLADGMPGSPLPTRQNILQHIDAIRLASRPGDWAILYFSGHGSQQPQQNLHSYSEPDGRDEIFLPYDIGRWDGQIGSVRNAIIDDEIGALLDGFTRAGVSVWAIFDTCHSGGMTKALPDSLETTARWRYVPPAELDVPVAADATNATPARRMGSLPQMRAKTPFSDAGTPSGYAVSFYSARYNEPAPEEPIPAAPAKQVHGVFTWYLAKAMERPSRTFHSMLQEIQQDYANDRRAFPTPSAEGRTELPLSVVAGVR